MQPAATPPEASTETTLPTPPTRELFDRYVLPTYGRFPLTLARGEGTRVWDEDGREYLDFGAGIAVSSLGHAHPRIIEALTRQARTLTHTSNLYYTRPQGLLAERVVRLVGQPGRVFFCNSGAEANEGLFKLARKFGHDSRPGGRFEVLTFHDSFHGRTLAGIAATGQEKVKKGFGPPTPGFLKATFNDLGSVERALTPQTAGILLEPIQGEIGIIPAEAEFLRGLRRLCDERDLLLMFDEIQCGFGRTGDWCAWHSLGAPEVVPDAIAWAKGMAAGFPMGAFWVREREVILANHDGGTTAASLPDLLGPGTHGTTFGGTPLGCAVSLETLSTIEEEDLLTNARERGVEARTALTGLGAAAIAAVRGTGLMLGVELDAAAVQAMPGFQKPSPAERTPAQKLVDQCQVAGLLLVPSGTHRVRWLPPLNVRREEIERAVEIFAGVLRAMQVH